MSATIENLPAGWAWAKLGEVCEFEYGKSLTKSNRSESGEYPVFGSNGIVGFHSEFLVEAPCIIVGRKGAAGEVHFSEKSCYPIDTTYFIKPNHLSPKFLFYQLKIMRLSELDRSTAIPGLNRNDAYQKDFALPPLPEQARIVEKLESLFARLAKAEAALTVVIGKSNAQGKCNELRQSILREAFAGRLLPQDPADEPAEMLLARLRAGTGKAPKTRQKK